MLSESLRTRYAVITQNVDPDDGLDLAQRVAGLPLVEGYIAYVEWSAAVMVRLHRPCLLERLRAFFPRSHFEVRHPRPQDAEWALEYGTETVGDWSELRLR